MILLGLIVSKFYREDPNLIFAAFPKLYVLIRFFCLEDSRGPICLDAQMRLMTTSFSPVFIPPINGKEIQEQDINLLKTLVTKSSFTKCENKCMQPSIFQLNLH